MLAPTAAAVNFDLLPSPEQQACSRNLEEGLKTFWCLVDACATPLLSINPWIKSRKPSFVVSW